MRTRFYIEKRKGPSGVLLREKRPVFMSVTFGGKRVILGTGIKTDLNAWDPEQQRIYQTFPDSKGYNSWLSILEETAEKAMIALRSSGKDINEKNFRSLYHELKPKYSSGFFDAFFQFMEAGVPKWSNSTYRKVRSVYKLLREYEDKTNQRISFGGMDVKFLESFMVFCSEKGYKQSTTYKTVNILVWYLNWTSDQGFNVYRDYRQFYKLMKPLNDPQRPLVSLNWEELISLKDFACETRKMERARDLFCFMCFSGLRYSELQRLKKEDINADEVLIRTPGKRMRRIPLNKYGREIYFAYENKYYLNHAAFPSMSIMTLNKYVKMIGKEAGLNRSVPSAQGGAERVELHARLTAGLAVNTFVSNAVELDVPAEIIALFTGIRYDRRVHLIKIEHAKSEIHKFDTL